ncbi:MAG TPA: DUF4231 domain-containing protein [Solirubrobacter sp.]
MPWPWGSGAAAQLDDGEALKQGTDFKQCRQLVDRYVVRHRNYYRRRAQKIRRVFRVAGVGVILFGAALPVAATFDGKHLQLIITVLTVLVALLTALRTFFQWDVQWRVLRQADWKLTYLLAKWETEIAALTAADGKDADAVAITASLINQAQEVVENEASSFFRGLGWPHPDTEPVPKEELGSKAAREKKARQKKSGKIGQFSAAGMTEAKDRDGADGQQPEGGTTPDPEPH